MYVKQVLTFLFMRILIFLETCKIIPVCLSHITHIALLQFNHCAVIMHFNGLGWFSQFSAYKQLC